MNYLLEVLTHDAVGYHYSVHRRVDQARDEQVRVYAEWRSKGWGQDPTSVLRSPKAIESVISLTTAAATA